MRGTSLFLSLGGKPTSNRIAFEDSTDFLVIGTKKLAPDFEGFETAFPERNVIPRHIAIRRSGSHIRQVGYVDVHKELLDPTAGDSLRGELAEAGPVGVQKADKILDSLQAVLAGALTDVFTVLVIASGLTFGAALLFRVSTDAKNARNV